MIQTTQYIVKYSMYTPVNRFKSQTLLHKLGIQRSLHKVLPSSEVSSDSQSVVNFTMIASRPKVGVYFSLDFVMPKLF